jgi:hypothetical protein
VQFRAFDEKDRTWSPWESISPMDSRVRWPDPPAVEAAQRREPTLEERVATIEKVLRASGTLPPA